MSHEEVTRGRRALVAGSTGLIGRHLVTLLAKEHAYEQVTPLVRKSAFAGVERVVERVVNFERLADAGDAFAVTDIYCALGTTTKATPDWDNYYQIDVTFPYEIARLGRECGATRFLIVTAVNANPSSPVRYLRYKGEVEERIRGLGYQDYHIFRPSLLAGRTEKMRTREERAIKVTNALRFLYVGAWEKYFPIEGEAVARAMIAAAKQDGTGTRIWERPDIIKASLAYQPETRRA